MTELIAVLVIKCKADTGAEIDGSTVEGERLSDRTDDALSQGDKIGISDPPRQNHKLISPEAKNVIAREERREPLGDGLEHSVTVIVPQEIVDLLEAVEIDAEHGIGFFCRSFVHRLRAYGFQKSAVRQLGQRVVAGNPVNILLGLQPASDFSRKIPDPECGIDESQKPGDIQGKQRMVQRIAVMPLDKLIQLLMPLEAPGEAEEKQEDREPTQYLHLGSGRSDAGHRTAPVG
ncbi:UNVERIFIED_ORG: hypothetical protein GGI66_005012 [Rhizobium esperanzae]